MDEYIAVGDKVRIMKTSDIQGIAGPVPYEQIEHKVGEYLGISKDLRVIIDFGGAGPLPFTVDVNPDYVERVYE